MDTLTLPCLWPVPEPEQSPKHKPGHSLHRLCALALSTVLAGCGVEVGGVIYDPRK
jgi:hypothetical protein